MYENGELVFVIVGEAEAYLCSVDWVPSWISAGYRVYGVASSVSEIEWLYQQAVKEDANS